MTELVLINLVIAQIMPLTVRAKGVSISTATNWAFNFLGIDTT